MNKKGITLIELVVVMVIIAIGAVLLAPNIGAWLPNYRLRSATRDAVSMLRTAQMKAVSTNISYGVGFDASAFQLYYQSTAGLIAEGGNINLPSGVQFNNNTFLVDGTLGKPFARFNTDSTCPNGGIVGSVTLQNTKGAQRTITVTTATGRIKIN